VAQVAALVAAAVHLLVFVWESILFLRPGIHADLFQVATRDVPPVRMWAFNVGFYNLFLGSGTIAGVVLWWAGHECPGRTLVVYTCVFMFLAGIALFASDRMAMSRPRGAGVVGALSQSTPPLVTLLALLLA
jgi:putative membrane protein